MSAQHPADLPPLPEPTHSSQAPDFTAEQMQAYARAALAQAQPSLTDERAAFEKSVAKDCGDMSTFGIGANMHYKNGLVESAWIGWLRRAAIATQAAQPETPEGGTLEDNVKYLLERCPYTVRSREGGGPESLTASLCITFTGMQYRLQGDPMFAPKKVQPVQAQGVPEDVQRAQVIAKTAQSFKDDVTHLGRLVYVNDLVWALGVLAAASQAAPPQAELATAAGHEAAAGHLVALVDEAQQILIYLHQYAIELQEHTRGGRSERGEVPIMDLAEDWLAARPDLERQQPAPLSKDADLFWDAKDGERFGHDIGDILEDYGPGKVVKIDCAKRLPSIWARMISDKGDYEVLTGTKGAK